MSCVVAQLRPQRSGWDKTQPTTLEYSFVLTHSIEVVGRNQPNRNPELSTNMKLTFPLRKEDR